jgi:MoxR-like ATPase
MNAPAGATQPASVDAVVELLAEHDYLCDRRLATAILIAMRINKPLFLEGEAGVGKTEAARALAAGLGARLIRLQCYEGIDLAHAA